MSTTGANIAPAWGSFKRGGFGSGASHGLTQPCHRSEDLVDGLSLIADPVVARTNLRDQDGDEGCENEHRPQAEL
jgi:hypothetical protein